MKHQEKAKRQKEVTQGRALELIEETKGKFFSITFKSFVDRSVITLSARTGVVKPLNANFAVHQIPLVKNRRNKKLITLFDSNAGRKYVGSSVLKGDYRSFWLNDLVSLKVKDTKYVVK